MKSHDQGEVAGYPCVMLLYRGLVKLTFCIVDSQICLGSFMIGT